MGTAPALAATHVGQNIYGSGSSAQYLSQHSVWDPDWQANTADHPTLSNSPSATYTKTASGDGLAEFGAGGGSQNCTAGVLCPASDPTANAAGQLDAFVGTDDPPTTQNLSDMSSAATGSASTTISAVTVPVEQAPVAVLLSVPTGITVGPSTKIKLTNSLVDSIYEGTIPAKGPYAENTWGALLEDAGLKLVTGTAAANQFSDSGSSSSQTGGYMTPTLQVRDQPSGTTYTFRGYLGLLDSSQYLNAGFYSLPATDDCNSSSWAPGIQSQISYGAPGDTCDQASGGNFSGGNLVTNTTETPGSIGYANLPDAAATTASPQPYTATFTSVSGYTQIAYAQVQSNGIATPVQYADPEAGDGTGKANTYTGSDINVNGDNANYVGYWNVPMSGGTFDPTGTWGGTLASDPNVYTHSGRHDYYPITLATYDVGWTNYNVKNSNLVSEYGGTSADALAAGFTAQSLEQYIVKAGQGQTDIKNADLYFADLPTAIDSYAAKAAAKVQ